MGLCQRHRFVLQVLTTFADFKQPITLCLSETNGKHKQQLKTLLTLKFKASKKKHKIIAVDIYISTITPNYR